MPREQFQTLSEPMYYVLLALTRECCGTGVMHRVAEISGGRVAVGPGTVYAMLEKFVTNGIIQEAARVGRKKTYLITEKGKSLLQREYKRSRILFADGWKVLEGDS